MARAIKSRSFKRRARRLRTHRRRLLPPVQRGLSVAGVRGFAVPREDARDEIGAGEGADVGLPSPPARSLLPPSPRHPVPVAPGEDVRSRRRRRRRLRRLFSRLREASTAAREVVFRRRQQRRLVHGQLPIAR